MYHAAGRKVVGGCTEGAIDLLQLIASARKMRGENKVRQFANTRREPVVYVLLESGSSIQRSLESERTKAGTEVDRCAFCIEAVSHEL